MRRFYTAESVTEGHPDKVCDQIADAILDECLRYDPSSRVACEVLATRGNVFVAGEISSGYEPPVFDVIRKVLEECGLFPCQHGAEKNLKKLDAEIREKVLRSALRLLPPDEDTKILINPSGKFVCGGFDADTGLTGRKLMVDTYGSMVPHGGGAFSGKDCSKVDRSAAYMARYIAKNIVVAEFASKCQVSLAYAIGVAEPVMIEVDTFGTGKVCADDCLAAAIPLVFGVTPVQIMESLRLNRPIFRQTAVFGHFGRKEFPLGADG